MARRQELKTSNLTQGFDTCQPQSFNETEDCVATTGLSALSGLESKEITDSADEQNEVLAALSGVENGGLSDLANLQSKGLSDLSSVENRGLSDSSDLRGSGLSSFSAAENGGLSDSANLQSQGLSDLSSVENARLSDSADLQSGGLSNLSNVENSGLSNSTDVHSRVLTNSCSIESPLISRAVPSVDENPELISETTENKTLADTDCRQYNHSELEMADGQTPTVSVESDQELLDVAQENVANDTGDLQCSDESRAPDTEDITVLEELSTASDAAAAVTASEERLVSNGHLGELLSCAECGSSGLSFSLLFSAVCLVDFCCTVLFLDSTQTVIRFLQNMLS